MGRARRKTNAERVVSWVEAKTGRFTTNQIIQESGCTRDTVEGVLAALGSVGFIRRIIRGTWTTELGPREWRQIVMRALRQTARLTPPMADPETLGKREAAKRVAATRAMECLVPLRGQVLLLDSGSQVAWCAQALADGISDPDSERRANYTRARVITNNCLAFLELLPFRETHQVDRLEVIGGQYLYDLAAFMPQRDHEGTVWDMIAEEATPIVLMSANALTEQGLYSHYSEQAPWKRLLIERADSLYMVADAEKLISAAGMTPPTGQLFVGPQHDRELWSAMWAKPHFHVIVGAAPGQPLTEEQQAVAKWLGQQLGERFEVVT